MIDQHYADMYHLDVYWAKAMDYQSEALLTCKAKTHPVVATVVCTEQGTWKWENGTMPVRCPGSVTYLYLDLLVRKHNKPFFFYLLTIAWMPSKNKQLSVLTQYIGWFITLFMLLGLLLLYFLNKCYRIVYLRYAKQLKRQSQLLTYDLTFNTN